MHPSPRCMVIGEILMVPDRRQDLTEAQELAKAEQAQTQGIKEDVTVGGDHAGSLQDTR